MYVLLLVLLFVAVQAAWSTGAMNSIPFFRWIGVPGSIVHFVNRYPEARSFADEYFLYAHSDQEISIEEDLRAGGIPLFIQWDHRWGYRSYGGEYLGITGCGPTCLSMVYCGLSGSTVWNPYEIARWAEESGYYVENVGTAWSLMNDGIIMLGLYSANVDLDWWSVSYFLNSGYPIICSMKPGIFTSEGHFIVITDIDDEGMLTIRDPNSRERSSRTWDFETILNEAAAMWAFFIL